MTYVTYTVGAKCILNLSDRDGATQSRHRPKHVLSDLTHGAFRTLKRRGNISMVTGDNTNARQY